MGILSALKKRQQEKKEAAEFKAQVEADIKTVRREGYRKQRIAQAEEEGKKIAEEELTKPKESGLQRVSRIAQNLSQSMEKADIMGTKDLTLDSDAFSLGSTMFGDQKKSKKKKDRGVGIA